MSNAPGAPTATVLGGGAAGKALHLARLGIAVQLLALPDDADLDRSALEQAGATHTAATERELTAQEPAQGVDGASVVFVALTHSVIRLLPPLRATGAPLWVDLSDWDGEPSELHDPFIEAGSHLFLSDMELADPLRTAEQLLPGKELVVITHGKRGATAFFPDTEPFFVLPYDAGPVVDTRGARDAFCSGTAYGFMHGWDWPRALHAGAVVAGGCVSSPEPADPELTVEWLQNHLDQRR